MQKIKRFVKNYIPIFAVVCFALFIISFVVLQIARTNMAFAEWVNGGIGAFLRQTGNFVFGRLPFSFAELMLILVPLAITAIIVFSLWRTRDRRLLVRMSVSLLAVISLFFTSYVYTLGAGYNSSPVSEKLSLSDSPPTKEELYDTLVIVREELNSLADEISYGENNSSVTDLSIDEVSSIVCDGYLTVFEKYPDLNLSTFDQRAKPVILSKGMTYLEILGIYTFFTGESNVNVHYPDYTLPFTVAHEFAHARGISRENEANFIAFLVCINTDNPYVRYSGYMNMFEYLASALASADRDLLDEVYRNTDSRIKREILAYYDFYNENKVELLGNISDFLNDNYLKAQGTEGIVSYGLVVRLCVSYYKNMASS